MSGGTDLAKRLRDIASDSTVFTFSPVTQGQLRAAAEEIDRYYNGMMAWKKTAETKDRKLSNEIAGRVSDRIAARAALASLAESAPVVGTGAFEIAWDDAGGQGHEINKIRARVWFEKGLLAQRAASVEAQEPTEEMLNAARDWSVKKYGIGIGNDAAIGCWKAMASVAPVAGVPHIERDAARYRYLRDHHIGNDPELINLEPVVPRGMDAAIDAAIAAQQAAS